jgi:hypothetical protein
VLLWPGHGFFFKNKIENNNEQGNDYCMPMQAGRTDVGSGHGYYIEREEWQARRETKERTEAGHNISTDTQHHTVEYTKRD